MSRSSSTPNSHRSSKFRPPDYQPDIPTLSMKPSFEASPDSTDSGPTVQDQEKAEQQFREIKQGLEDSKSYYGKLARLFETAYSKTIDSPNLEQTDKELLLTTFLNGLRDELKKNVKSYGARDVHEARRFTRHEEMFAAWGAIIRSSHLTDRTHAIEILLNLLHSSSLGTLEKMSAIEAVLNEVKARSTNDMASITASLQQINERMLKVEAEKFSYEYSMSNHFLKIVDEVTNFMIGTFSKGLEIRLTSSMTHMLENKLEAILDSRLDKVLEKVFEEKLEVMFEEKLDERLKHASEDIVAELQPQEVSNKMEEIQCIVDNGYNLTRRAYQEAQKFAPRNGKDNFNHRQLAPRSVEELKKEIGHDRTYRRRQEASKRAMEKEKRRKERDEKRARFRAAKEAKEAKEAKKNLKRAKERDDSNPPPVKLPYEPTDQFKAVMLRLLANVTENGRDRHRQAIHQLQHPSTTAYPAPPNADIHNQHIPPHASGFAHVAPMGTVAPIQDPQDRHYQSISRPPHPMTPAYATPVLPPNADTPNQHMPSHAPVYAHVAPMETVAPIQDSQDRHYQSIRRPPHPATLAYPAPTPPPNANVYDEHMPPQASTPVFRHADHMDMAATSQDRPHPTASPAYHHGFKVADHQDHPGQFVTSMPPPMASPAYHNGYQVAETTVFAHEHPSTPQYDYDQHDRFVTSTPVDHQYSYSHDQAMNSPDETVKDTVMPPQAPVQNFSMKQEIMDSPQKSQLPPTMLPSPQIPSVNGSERSMPVEEASVPKKAKTKRFNLDAASMPGSGQLSDRLPPRSKVVPQAAMPNHAPNKFVNSMREVLPPQPVVYKEPEPVKNLAVCIKEEPQDYNEYEPPYVPEPNPKETEAYEKAYAYLQEKEVEDFVIKDIIAGENFLQTLISEHEKVSYKCNELEKWITSHKPLISNYSCYLCKSDYPGHQPYMCPNVTSIEERIKTINELPSWMLCCKKCYKPHSKGCTIKMFECAFCTYANAESNGNSLLTTDHPMMMCPRHEKYHETKKLRNTLYRASQIYEQNLKAP